MDNSKKEKLIKRQRFVIRTFWTTIFFLLGFLFAVWQTWEQAGHDVLDDVFPAIILIIFVLVIELVIMAILFIAIGKKEKPKSSDTLEQIEKLGKLKAQGLISDEEFEKEKKKLCTQD